MRIVLIVLDDVSFYSLGFTEFFSNSTPNIDKLSRVGHVFWNAHCNIPFCQPSRSVLMTGLYPQNNGSTEFSPIKDSVRTLSSILKENGYHTVISGKTSHYKPYSVYNWDESYEKNDLDPFVVSLVSKSLKHNKCFLNINLKMPHRPFFDSTSLREIRLPNFLPATKNMTKEVLDYLETLSIADDVVGKILALTTMDDLVVLTSDHGSSFPYIKGNCYGVSTNVPLIYVNKHIPACEDKINVVSHVDFVSTLLDLVGISIEVGFDGESYAETLLLKKNKKNNLVYSQLNRMFYGPKCRMRSIASRSYCYTINIDSHYPAEFVDGWGWKKSVCEIKDSFFYSRDEEELFRYSKLDLFKIECEPIRSYMRFILLKTMKKYKDLELYNIAPDLLLL